MTARHLIPIARAVYASCTRAGATRRPCTPLSPGRAKNTPRRRTGRRTLPERSRRPRVRRWPILGKHGSHLPPLLPSASQIVDLAPGSFGSARSAHGGARRRPAPGCRTGRCSTTCNPGGMSFTLAQRGVDGIDHFPVGSHDHRGKAHSTCLVTALPYQLSEPEPERLRRAISSTIRSRMRFSHPSSLGAKNFSPASSGGRHVMSTTFSSVSCA